MSYHFIRNSPNHFIVRSHFIKYILKPKLFDHFIKRISDFLDEVFGIKNRYVLK